MRNPKLALVLNSDSHSKNASVGPLRNPWPIQLYKHHCPGVYVAEVVNRSPEGKLAWFLAGKELRSANKFTQDFNANTTLHSDAWYAWKADDYALCCYASTIDEALESGLVRRTNANLKLLPVIAHNSGPFSSVHTQQEIHTISDFWRWWKQTSGHMQRVPRQMGCQMLACAMVTAEVINCEVQLISLGSDQVAKARNFPVTLETHLPCRWTSTLDRNKANHPGDGQLNHRLHSSTTTAKRCALEFYLPPSSCTRMSEWNCCRQNTHLHWKSRLCSYRIGIGAANIVIRELLQLAKTFFKDQHTTKYNFDVS